MRILQLTNYPTVNPLHGGQLRCANIASALRHAGHAVKSVAVYVEYWYADTDVALDDISFNRSSSHWDDRLPWISDYHTGLFASTDNRAVKALEAIVNDFKPHIIISEHPWLFKAAKNLARKNTRLVYSSHNVEWRLKDGVLMRSGIGGAERSTLIASVKKAELDAAHEANLVVACTTGDAEYYAKETGNMHVVVAGNGVEPFSCSQSRVAEWQDYFQRPTAVYVSSAHPPNINGFWDMMDPGLTFLAPEEKILIIGGASDAMIHAEGAQGFRNLNESRLNLGGTREKQELQAMVCASHVVLLPITSGEGSNLKTAEALESGCYVIGTTKAFRGFETAMSLEHVYIADDSETFRRKVRQVLDAPRYTKGTPLEIRSQFHWQQQLNPMIDAINAL